MRSFWPACLVLAGLMCVSPGCASDSAGSSPGSEYLAEQGITPPEIVFVGKDPGARWRGVVRGAVDDVVAYAHQRHGLAPPGVTVYIGDSRREVSAAYREYSGRDWPGFSCGLADGTATFVVSSLDADCRFELEAIIAHEYFHVLQDHLRPWEEWGYLEPAWLTEGSAEYFAARYAFDDERYRAFAARYRELARLYDFEDAPADEFAPYVLGFVALDWLADRAGDDAHLEYFRLTHERGDRAVAFREAFGMTIDDFYRAFEAFRADIGALPRWIRGTVLGPRGVRQAGVGVAVCPFYEGRALAPWTVVATSEDGTFRTLAGVNDDHYVLAVQAEVDGEQELIGWYRAEGGFTHRYEEATVLRMEGAGVEGLLIRLPAEPVAIATVTDCQPVLTTPAP